MSKLASALTMTLFAASLTGGCREQDPPEAFNYDLGGETGERMMPGVAAYTAAYDASILKGGNTRAQIVKLDEFDPANVPQPEQAIVAATGPDLAPATGGVGDALGSVGKAFLGNLLGGKPAGSAPSGAGQQAGATAPPAATPGGALAAEDATAINDLIEQYNQARTAREFIDIPTLCVASQRSVAGDYYDLLDGLYASFANLLDTIEDEDAALKSRIADQIAGNLAAVTLSNLGATGPDVASATLTPPGGGSSVTVTFQRESGSWRINDPFVPAGSAWSGVKSALEQATEALDEFDDAVLTSGTLDAARAEQLLARAVELLSGKAS
jgi:hypothetical protein